MTITLPPQAQDAMTTQLQAIRDRLLEPGDARPDPESLDITTREKGSGVLVVTVQGRADDVHRVTPTTATFELHPRTQDGEVTYTSTEVDYSSSDY